MGPSCQEFIECWVADCSLVRGHGLPDGWVEGSNFFELLIIALYSCSQRSSFIHSININCDLPMYQTWLCVLDVCMRVCSVASVKSDSLQHYDRSPPASSVYGIIQARILEWVSMPSFRVSSRPRDWTCVCLHLFHCKWILYPLSHLGSPCAGYTLANKQNPWHSHAWITSERKKAIKKDKVEMY